MPSSNSLARAGCALILDDDEAGKGPTSSVSSLTCCVPCPEGRRTASEHLDGLRILDKLFDMDVNVSELLRNFTKIRQAALGGERVVIHTREGRLVLMADKPTASSLFGAMSGSIDSKSLSAEESGADLDAWRPSL